MAQHTILTDTNAFIKSKQSKHQVKQPTKIKRLKDTAAARTYMYIVHWSDNTAQMHSRSFAASVTDQTDKDCLQ